MVVVPVVSSSHRDLGVSLARRPHAPETRPVSSAPRTRTRTRSKTVEWFGGFPEYFDVDWILMGFHNFQKRKSTLIDIWLIFDWYLQNLDFSFWLVKWCTSLFSEFLLDLQFLLSSKSYLPRSTPRQHTSVISHLQDSRVCRNVQNIRNRNHLKWI